MPIDSLSGFPIPARLEDDNVVLLKLQLSDFDTLYEVACDPLIWEQHPNKDRWKKDVFQTYFEGAMESKGAFRIIDKENGQTAGCTRFYDYHPEESSLLIGYTFYARQYWGTGLNHRVKGLMLDYAFRYVDTVYFHIGSENYRSQLSITRLGASKSGEIEVAYYGEPSKLNYVYRLHKADWEQRNKN